MKRGIGVKSKILLDVLDLEIINILNSVPSGIMELQKKLFIKHKSLRKHLDKLIKVDLVKSAQVPKSRKKILTIPQNQDLKILIKILEKINKA